MQELKHKLRTRVSQVQEYFDEQRRQRIYTWMLLTLGRLYIDACIKMRAVAFKIYVFIYWTLVGCCNKLFAGKAPRVVYAEMDGNDITFEAKVAYTYPRGNTTNVTLEDLLATIDWFRGGTCCANIVTIYWADRDDNGGINMRLSKIDLTSKIEITTQSDILFGCINFSMLGSVRMTPQMC